MFAALAFLTTVHMFGGRTSMFTQSFRPSKFRFYLVADQDQKSRDDHKDSWHSFIAVGKLERMSNGSYAVAVNEPMKVFGGYSLRGRGMELSEAVIWNGRLLTFDDRTGIVYEIDTRTYDLYPRYIVPSGNGSMSKGCKIEWATIVDGVLYMGAAGKEWTNKSPELDDWHPTWVHTLSQHEHGVTHVNWTQQYSVIRHALQSDFPNGYVIHEAVEFSSLHRRWYFLPRRVSHHRYTAADALGSGANVLVSCNEQFRDVQVVKVGTRIPHRGYSSMKFIPDSRDEEIIALKTEETEEGEFRSFVTILNRNGEVIMDDLQISTEAKYEGIEIIPMPE